jgi:hypothetical protein
VNTRPSARRKQLEQAARPFARQIRDVLNATVCTSATVSAAVTWGGELGQDVVIVGTKMGRGLIARPVPLCIDQKKPKCWFEAQFRCDVDDRGYLRVLVSYFAIYAHDGLMPLCHYDYERNKEGYPAAHVQIEGHSAALGELPGDRDAGDLGRLHFPVGGRRYRPTVEDMVEFVVTEGFARGRDGWEQVVKANRDSFHEIQLRAAVRRHPGIARAVLTEIDTAADA